jgi:TRAP-type C4-dicarboxylate transport system permease small subunit
MLDGFFGSYQALALVIFLGVLFFVFLLAWGFTKIFKSSWASLVVILISSFVFYFVDMTFISVVFLISAIILAIILIIKLIKTKNAKK